MKTCKYLRKSDLPGKVVSITENVTTRITDKRLLSAILTTRGSVFSDLDNLELAKHSALHAIKIYPKSFHPHMLMGAILYQEGNPSLGDEYFAEAERLGANMRDQEFEIRSALNKSAPDARLKVVKYLISKDPEKYACVHKVC